MISVTVDSKREYVKLGSDEREASAQAHDLLAARDRGRVTRTRSGSGFTDVADAWVADMKKRKADKPGYVRTMESRKRALCLWFGDTAVQDITVKMVTRWRDEAVDRRAPNTVIGQYTCLRQILAHAQEDELIDVLPLPLTLKVEKKPSRRPNHMTWKECDLVIRSLPEPYNDMADLALLTGLRVGEIAALKVGDVNVKAKILTVRSNLAGDGSIGAPKTRHSRRAIKLSPRAMRVIRRAVKNAGPDGRLFPVKSVGMCGYEMRKTLKDLGLYVKGRGWHAFRHAHRVLLEEFGMSIRDAAARLGHGPNFAQTEGYGWQGEAVDPKGIDQELVRLHRATSRVG